MQKTFVANATDEAIIKDLLSPQTIYVDLAKFLCIDCYLNSYASTEELKKQRLNLNLSIDKKNE